MLTHPVTNQTILPAFCRARVLVLGVGNILFGDDGFGPAIAEILNRDYVIPDDIYVMDVGTGVRKLLFTLALSEGKPEEIIIADAVDWGIDFGQVKAISVEELPVTKVDDFSLHQVPTSNMLRELQDQSGVAVTVIVCDVGVIPKFINQGLSPIIKKAARDASRIIAERFSLQERA